MVCFSFSISFPRTSKYHKCNLTQRILTLCKLALSCSLGRKCYFNLKHSEVIKMTCGKDGNRT